MPTTRIETIPLKKGEYLSATEERNGAVVITIQALEDHPKAGKLPIPDLEARLKKIYGDKMVPGANPILREREESSW